MKCFLIILLMASFSYSKPNLKFERPAQKFLKERHLFSGHRMNFYAPVKKNSKKSFIVEVDTTTETQSVALKEKFHVTKNEDNSLRIKNGAFNVAMDEIKKDKLKFSEMVAKKLLPVSVAKQFDYISVDVEKQLSLESGRVDDVGYILNYQRVYNNRIVRSANDYLIIAIDSSGCLKWAEISMSDLKTTLEYVETVESVEENVEALDSVVTTTIDSLEDYQRREKIGVKSVVANSAAEAYCTVEDENKIKLHPCISYATTLMLEDGATFSTIIDAPHSLKSWREYKNGKKKHFHYADNGTGNPVLVLRR